MKKYINGIYRDMTTEELVAMMDAAAQAEAEEKHRPLSLGEVQEMMVRAQINTLSVDDATALRMVAYYPDWTAGTAYAAGDRLVYNGDLYKVLQAHTAQEQWEPDASPSLFAKVLIPDSNAIPAWEQPDSTNAYMKGDKVTRNGKTWVSDVDNNVWEPGVYGWTEART